MSSSLSPRKPSNHEPQTFAHLRSHRDGRSLAMMRVAMLKGTDAGRYYTERLPGYYLDGGEPPGRWWGSAAVGLGLSDQVDAEAFLAVMGGTASVLG